MVTLNMIDENFGDFLTQIYFILRSDIKHRYNAIVVKAQVPFIFNFTIFFVNIDG